MWEPPDGGDFIQPNEIKAEGSTGIGVATIFLGNRQDYTVGKETIATKRAALRQKVMTKFGKMNFNQLTEEQKVACLWLEFIAFGHRMAPASLEQHLQGLSVANRRIFKDAYEIIELERMSMTDIKGSMQADPDLFNRFVTAAMNNRKTEAQLETANTKIKALQAENSEFKAKIKKLEERECRRKERMERELEERSAESPTSDHSELKKKKKKLSSASGHHQEHKKEK
jgi:hypothetical protein